MNLIKLIEKYLFYKKTHLKVIKTVTSRVCGRDCNLSLSKEMGEEYGLKEHENLSYFAELFYQKGKKDALQELKDKI